jgi:hypothetical protein
VKRLRRDGIELIVAGRFAGEFEDLVSGSGNQCLCSSARRNEAEADNCEGKAHYQSYSLVERRRHDGAGGPK